MTNQCDGCMQGNEADDLGFHRDAKGMPYMMCTSSLYGTDVVEAFNEYEAEMVNDPGNSEDPKERLG